ncbi:uncharacterized protein LOC132949037 [Metopolophium dirhodum]|uniref:uncharacterized protein LOC132949037 n=1 Tax=Metopolophium dirhodum TaxID=44670 RepID=UPI002990204E|nr:uncharacterized protein LOC132949037 [Metopolophium dirhodum]
MGQNNKDVCKSDRCCCQLISKCEEKPKPRKNVCGGREERTEMSICDFLKSQPIPEWIKVNTGRPQHGRNPCSEANDSKDRQRGPCGQAPPSSNCGSGKNRTTYVHQPKSQPEWVRSSEQLCLPNNGGMQQSQHRNRNDQRSQPSTCDTEDRQLSQIIINFGTVVTSDSGQQNNSEVQEVPSEKKRRTCKSTARPPPDRSSCTRGPTDRSTSTCPPAERSTSTCQPPERPIPTCPPERSSCTRAPADRPNPTCPPPDRSSCTRGPSDRSTSTCPTERSSCPRAPADRPIPTCPSERSSCPRAPADRPNPTCPPPDRSSCTRGPADRSTSTCPIERSSCPRAQADRPIPTCPSERSSCPRAPADRPIPTCPSERSSCPRAQADRPIPTCPSERSSCPRASADRSICGSGAPADRSTSSCPLAGRSSFTLPQASSTFIRPSMDRSNFTCPQADRNNRSISTRSPPDWSTRSLADRSNSVRPPNVRPPNVRPPNVRPYGMESNTTTRGSYSRYQDNPSTQQRAHSESGMKSKTSSCYCDNGNLDY